MKDKKDRNIEDILNRDGRMMRSPVLWFVVLFIPVLLGLYVSLKQQDVVRNPDVPETMVQFEGAAAPPEPVATPHDFITTPNDITTPRRRYKQGAAVHPGNSLRDMPQPACEFSDWLGKPADPAMQGAMKATGRPFRILPPGSMMTMDYSASRVNFDLDAGGNITRVWCG